jgi:undecaprenyl-diphosphatase
MKILSKLHISENHIKKVEVFINKHGRFSIFFGRLLPVIKENIAFVSGLVNIKYSKFIFWDTLGAFTWSLQYVEIGYIFSSSLQVAQLWLEKSLYVLLIIAFVFGLIYISLILIKKNIPIVLSIIESILQAALQNPHIRNFINNHPKLIIFIKNRLNTSTFFGLPLTLLILVFLYIFGLFAGSIEDFLTKDPIVNIDKILSSFIPTIRTEFLTKIFTYITYFGTSQVVIAFLVAVTFILIINQKSRYIIPLLISTIGASVSVYISKIAFHRPRPDIAIYYEPSYSFPSGHATIAVALYGFVAYLIIHFLKSTKQKLNTLFFALIFILLIGISRIYLGEHYLSDVYSGYLLGFLWLIIGIAITKVLEEKYKSLKIKSIKHNKVFSFFVILGFLTFYIAFSQTFHYKLNQSKHQTFIMIKNFKNINKFTQSIIGINTWPINVIFIGNFEKIKNSLIQKDWKISKIPLPIFWNYKKADLTLKKGSYILKIWKTNYLISNHHILVGLIIKLNSSHFIPNFSSDIDASRKFLEKEFKSKEIQLIKPFIGKDILGNHFFTNGKCAMIR